MHLLQPLLLATQLSMVLSFPTINTASVQVQVPTTKARALSSLSPMTKRNETAEGLGDETARVLENLRNASARVLETVNLTTENLKDALEKGDGELGGAVEKAVGELEAANVYFTSETPPSQN